MEIITGRYAEPLLGFPSYGIITTNVNGYRGEKNIIKEILEPVDAENKIYSDLYILERAKLLDIPFNWIYIINEEWLKRNKNEIFNYSQNNSPEFQEFVDAVQFPIMEKEKLNKKESNHLLTKLGIPFNSIDGIIVMRNYPGHFRALNYIRKFVPHKREIHHYKTSGSNADLNIPKGIEFVLR